MFFKTQYYWIANISDASNNSYINSGNIIALFFYAQSCNFLGFTPWQNKLRIEWLVLGIKVWFYLLTAVINQKPALVVWNNRISLMLHLFDV